MNNILISVIVPAYNAMSTLRRTIESVINQTHNKLELIIIDDGSDQDLRPIISEFNDHRIHYHKLPHKNANIARNFGIEMSKGRYIAMIDADDRWLVNHLEYCLVELHKTEADGLYGSVHVVHPITESTIYARCLNKNETMLDYLLSTGFGAQTSTLFMTSESTKAILWDADLERHQDYDLIVQYSKHLKLIPKVEATVLYIEVVLTNLN